MGGIILQDYLFEHFKKLPFKFDAVILEGSFIVRKNLDKSSNPKFPPVLTIGAELDWLARVTRMAESYYFNDLMTVKDHTYTIVIPGMNPYCAFSYLLEKKIKKRKILIYNKLYNSSSFSISSLYILLKS